MRWLKLSSMSKRNRTASNQLAPSPNSVPQNSRILHGIAAPVSSTLSEFRSRKPVENSGVL
jgi:hypothetical protein